MIWDYIRDFLVQYIFGGCDSNGSYFSPSIGYFIDKDDEIVTTADEMYFSFNDGIYTLGDWLSTTATIIIMCIAVFLMIMLVRWVWRLVTSAFLLK